jgi:hypothetical protein
LAQAKLGLMLAPTSARLRLTHRSSAASIAPIAAVEHMTVENAGVFGATRASISTSDDVARQVG